MAWTPPKTDFDPGDVLTAAEMNAIGGNLEALYVPIQRLAYQERTTTFSVTSTTDPGTTDVFASDLTWTADGTSAYQVVFFCENMATGTTANADVTVNLVTGGGTDLGRLAVVGVGDGTRAHYNTVYAVRWYTPAAGSASVNVRAWRNLANGNLNAGAGGPGTTMPMWMAVYGPALT